jgi:hypothetical protein
MSYTREQIETAVKAKGYKWFEDASNKSYDVNIVGVRNTSPAVYKKVTNVFDDHLTISFKDEKGSWQYYCWNLYHQQLLVFPHSICNFYQTKRAVGTINTNLQSRRDKRTIINIIVRISLNITMHVLCIVLCILLWI